jgi:hypothetical protein
MIIAFMYAKLKTSPKGKRGLKFAKGIMTTRIMTGMMIMAGTNTESRWRSGKNLWIKN